MTWALRHADQQISAWADHFKSGSRDYYPRAPDGGGNIAGFHAALTQLEPADYERIACRWPIARALVYLEQRRVHRSFQDLKSNG
ncbi:MAG: hypothetical protein FKY71_18435 [Spiribacter salinus]|uniref:Uncharacterized protein n=1 Tax=Spiribacter salinus TaxID=1335746 RepID=A0A540V8Q5_9GAMM|nr:MAG: hypothetical protein FKY71_18435 [Spiribacter salinus]